MLQAIQSGSKKLPGENADIKIIQLFLIPHGEKVRRKKAFVGPIGASGEFIRSLQLSINGMRVGSPQSRFLLMNRLTTTNRIDMGKDLFVTPASPRPSRGPRSTRCSARVGHPIPGTLCDQCRLRNYQGLHAADTRSSGQC